MSASRMPTFEPERLKPEREIDRTVDLPTPPLPDATAMMAPTPGTPAFGGRCPGSGMASSGGGGLPGGALPGLRSAVNATITCSTPRTPRTAASAAARSGSRSRAWSAGTDTEKITFPFETTISETRPRLTISPWPAGPGTRFSAARMSSLEAAAIPVSATRVGISVTYGLHPARSNCRGRAPTAVCFNDGRRTDISARVKR